MPEILQLRTVLALLRAHVAELRRQGAEDGYTTETLNITAFLVAAGGVAGGLIVRRREPGAWPTATVARSATSG